MVENKQSSGRRKKVNDNNLWPVVAIHFPYNKYLFMNDNAHVHRFHLSTTYKNNNIPMLENHAQSPDLNPIWLAIKRKLPSNTSNLVDELHGKKNLKM